MLIKLKIHNSGMAENVKFIEKRNSEEKAPEKEHFQHIKELIHHLHRKKPVELSSVEDVLKAIDRDWKSGGLQEGADEVEKDKEKFIKKFKANEKLTAEMKSAMERVGRGVLSEDEIKEAKERFGGAKYSWSRYSVAPVATAQQRASRIELIRTAALLDSVARYGEEIHESAHYIHFFITEKQLERGDIQDPILKKLYGYMHGRYSNETIEAAERAYLGKRYEETIANALMYHTVHSRLRSGDTSGDSRDFRVIVEFRLIGRDIRDLEHLIESNPKRFRELIENPSLWVEAGSVESLVKRLKRE
jgi:hypothetical protein